MTYTISKEMFGDKIAITLFDIEQSIAEDLAEEAYTEGLRLQKIFNLYDPQSELSKLNKKRTLVCSDDLVLVIKHALHYCQLSDGAYDISIGSLFLQRKNSKPEVKPSCSYNDIRVEGNTITLLHDDVIIDLGSIAKGYIVDAIVAFLNENGVESGIVDGRGDISVFGNQETIVDIQHPRDSTQHIHSLYITNEAVATSGDYNQFTKQYETSHIINKKELSSVTVVAKTVEIADVLATLVSVLGESEIQKIMNFDETIRIVTVDTHLNVRIYDKKE